MQNKNIALLIPVYNNQASLEKSVLSIHGADKEMVDIVIIDDGSSIPANLDKLQNYNIHLIRFENNQGIVAALNSGLRYAFANNYQYIARLDAGDLIINNRFIKQYNFLEKNPDVGIVGGWAQTYDAQTDTSSFMIKQPGDDANIRKSMCLNNSFIHPAVMMRSEILQKVGLYDKKFKTAAQDYDYFFRILKTCKGANIQEALIVYEINNISAISYKRRRSQLTNRFIIQLKYFDISNIYSYLGVLRTIFIYMLPYSLIREIKKHIRCKIK